MWPRKDACQGRSQSGQQWFCEGRLRCGRFVFKSRAVSASDSAQQPLSPSLKRARDEYLIQARIGFGERGRGLFFQPLSSGSGLAPLAASPCPSPSPGPSASFLPGDDTQLELLRVPLCAGLTLVADSGPAELQQQLLVEWQAHHGLELPSPLAALLSATDRPPALRLAAWLLWVSLVAVPPSTRLGYPVGARDSPTVCLPPAAAQQQLGLTHPSQQQQQQPSPHAGEPRPDLKQQMRQQERQRLYTAAAQYGSSLVEFARDVLPPITSAASCLRLARAGTARLPLDVRTALAGMRAQVLSYSSELRRLGLDWGCDDAVLWWAFDMVTSRGFSATASLPLPPPPSIHSHLPPPPPPPASAAASGYFPSGSASAALKTPAAVSLALYMPWACLLNHSPSPNATFHADLCRREFVVSPRKRFTPLEPGVELCISYGDDLDNVRQLLKYGFCTPGNVNDRLVLTPEVAAAARGLRRQALCGAAEVLADGAASRGGGGEWRNRVYAVLATLLDPLTAGPSSGPRYGTANCLTTLRDWAAAEMSRFQATGYVASEDYGKEEEEEPFGLVPDSVLLPECSQLTAGIAALNMERKLMLVCCTELLAMYGNSRL